MIERIKKRNKTIVFTQGFLLGIIIFTLIYGVKILDVTYDGWLLNGGDISQHYIGWKLYRNSSWGIPFGLIEGLIYPDKVSVIYMDAIPIFALIFKILSPILPNTFQYFGIWGLFCFAMQGAIGALIIYRFTKDKILCGVSSIFFIIFPVVFQRLFGHSALAGNWVILLIIYIYLIHLKEFKLNVLVWSLLAMLTVTIHLYFFPIFFIFLLCHLLRNYIENKNLKENIIIFLCSMFSIFFILTLFGAFVGKSSLSDGGLGFYNTNINSLINPWGYSKFLKNMPLATQGQGEGFAYLGLGIIILFIIAIYIQLNKKYEKKKINEVLFENRTKMLLGIACLILYLLALSVNVTFNDKTLFTISCPKILEKLLGVFRSSGRFMWPVCYVILIYSIRNIVKSNKKYIALVIITLCLIVQILDLSHVIKGKHSELAETKINYVSKLDEGLWSKLENPKYKHIVFLYEVFDMSTEEGLIWDICNFAIENNITMNDGMIARKDSKSLNKQKSDIIKGLENFESEDDTIYLLSPNGNSMFFESYNLNCYMSNGIIIGVKDKIYGAEDYEINSITNEELKNGVDIMYKNDRYLTNGSYENDIRILHQGGISYGPYIPLDEGTYNVKILGDNLNNSRYDVCFNGGENKLKLELINSTNNEIEYKISTDKRIKDMEFRIFNDFGDDIKIYKILLSKN